MAKNWVGSVEGLHKKDQKQIKKLILLSTFLSYGSTLEDRKVPKLLIVVTWIRIPKKIIIVGLQLLGSW